MKTVKLTNSPILYFPQKEKALALTPQSNTPATTEGENGEDTETSTMDFGTQRKFTKAKVGIVTS